MDAATYAYSSTAMPMLTGTLITAAGFLPVGLARSTVGEYTFAIFAVTALALVLSWLAAVYFTPYLGYLLLKTRPAAAAAARRAASMKSSTPRCTSVSGAWSTGAYLAQIGHRGHAGAVRAGPVRLPVRRAPVLPRLQPSRADGGAVAARGRQLAQTEAEAKRFERALRGDAQIESVTTFVGSGTPRFYLPLDQIFPQSNVAQLIVMPTSLAERAALRRACSACWPPTSPSCAGASAAAERPPVAYPVQFRVIGPEAAGVRRLADQVRAQMEANPNTVGVNDNWNESVKMLRLEVDGTRRVRSA